MYKNVIDTYYNNNNDKSPVTDREGNNQFYDKNPNKGIDFRKEIVKKMVDQNQWVDPTLGHQLLRKDVNVDPINSSAHDGQDKNMKSHWAIGKDVPMEEADQALINLIKNNGDWIDPS